MTLRKLGRSVFNQNSIDESFADRMRDLIEQLKIQNRYLALMNNEDDPPTRNEDIDLP